MIEAPSQPRPWSTLKWAGFVAGIFALQAGFFCWSARTTVHAPPAPPTAFVLDLASGEPGYLAGTVNPYLLVRPDIRGFSGSAWLRIPPIAYSPEQTNPPPFQLEIRTDRIGATVMQAISNSLEGPFLVSGRTEPQFDDLNYFPPPDAAEPDSTFSVEGGLARRKLLNPPKLAPQPSDVILTNTTVEIVVDSEGNVFAPPVILSLSGSQDADDKALGVAAGLRFEPLTREPGRPEPDAGRLTAGHLVFCWQTVPKPAPATNAP